MRARGWGNFPDVEGSGPPPLKPWHLPIAVAGIAVPIIGATMLGGAPAGLGAAFAVAATIVFLAVRATPREPIEVAGGGGDHARLLVIARTVLDEPYAAESIAAAADELGDGRPGEAEVLVVAPAA